MNNQPETKSITLANYLGFRTKSNLNFYSQQITNKVEREIKNHGVKREGNNKLIKIKVVDLQFNSTTFVFNPNCKVEVTLGNDTTFTRVFEYRSGQLPAALNGLSSESAMHILNDYRVQEYLSSN